MQIRKAVLLLPAAAVVAVVSGSLAAQDKETYTAPLTEYGQPDLQGVWNFSSNTPMQRDKRYGEQEFLTLEQVEERRKEVAARAAAADAAAARRVEDPDAPPVTDNPGGYNDFWV